MTRRDALQLVGSGILVATVPGTASEPGNISYPLGLIDGRITPSNRFFVRDHFAPPEIALASWRLRVEGSVEKPCEVAFSDLLEGNVKQVEAVLECAGNVAGGSAVSNGVWRGVSLAELLQLAKPARDAAFVLLEGADRGRLFEHHSDLPYGRVVPIQRCLEPDSLVAFQLNGQALPARNGFPARVLFPGWYGMDSVKWLKRVVVMSAEEASTAYQANGMDRLYSRVVMNGDSPQRISLGSTQIKSVVSWPGQESKLPAARYTIWGFAWGGRGCVREVQVSTDAGNSWGRAALTPCEGQHSWVRWTFDWRNSPGEYVILSRAMDESGTRQPLTRDMQRRDQYELNWCAPVRCSVR